MVGAYIDEIIMFFGGAFAAYVGRKWLTLGIGDKLPPAQQEGFAKMLKVGGLLLMALALLLAIFEAVRAA